MYDALTELLMSLTSIVLSSANVLSSTTLRTLRTLNVFSTQHTRVATRTRLPASRNNFKHIRARRDRAMASHFQGGDPGSVGQACAVDTTVHQQTTAHHTIPYHTSMSADNVTHPHQQTTVHPLARAARAPTASTKAARRLG